MSKRARPSNNDEPSPANKRPRNSENGVPNDTLSTIKHKKGSIVRVTLHNFITYTDSTFYPGPLLNIVIGPNGSGKSSIVCGLVLGLGGSPKLLGRAKQIGEFVKHGFNDGWVELELAVANKNGNNVTIRRMINKQNGSDWLLDGKAVNKTVIHDFIKSLNVQIDNVCQFLPQDKVVTFAKLDQYDLLKETEKAVGPPKMVEYHEKLIKTHSSRYENQLEIRNKEKHLADLKQKNELLERDVNRLRERELLLKQVSLMKKKRPWIEYKQQKVQLSEVEKEFKKARKELDEKEKSIQPTLKKIEKIQEEVKIMEENRTKFQSALKSLDSERRNLGKQQEHYSDEYIKVKKSLESLRRRHDDRMKQAQQIQMNIQALQDNLAALPDPEDNRAEEARIRSIYEQKRNEQTEIKDQISTIQYQAMRLQEQLKKCTNDVTRLNNLQEAKLNELRKHHSDVYNARVWIQEQTVKGTFKQKVYGPLLMEITVADEYYARCIETQCPSWLLEAFLCQNSDDFDIIMDNLYSRQKLQINVVRTDTINPNLANAHPLQNDLRQRCGLLGWVGDFVECDKIVKVCLAANAGINSAVIGDQNTIRCIKEVLEISGGFSRVYTPESVYTTTQSRYGNRAKSTRVFNLKTSAKLITGIDSKKIEAIQNEIGRLKHELKGFDSQKRELEQKDQQLANEMQHLISQRDALHQVQRKKNDLEKRIAENKRQYQELQQEEDITTQETKLKQALKKNAMHQAKLLIEMKNTTKKLTDLALRNDFNILSRTEKRVELQHLQIERQQFEDQTKRLKNNCRDLENQLNNMKRKAKAAYDKAHDIAPITKDEELKKIFETFPDDLDELDLKITETEERAKINDRNPKIIQDFENRRQEVNFLSSFLYSTFHIEFCGCRSKYSKKNWQKSPTILKIAREISRH